MATRTPEEMTQDEVLASAFNKHGHGGVETYTPLSALIDGEEGDSADEAAIRRETLEKMLEYFFADGPAPHRVMKRLYALVKAIRSDLILHMSCEEIGKLFGETRAAVSWRVQQCFNKLIERNGGVGKAPFQKSDGAREAYAAAQKGNTNRRGKKLWKSK